MAKKVNNIPRIIGITGAFGSGKSTASAFFSKNGYNDITLSSFLEEEAHNRGITRVTRKLLQDIGNEWRQTYGKGVLAQRALDIVKNGQKLVIDGIRNTGEIEVLRKSGNFLLLAIVSDRKKRFERIQQAKNREEMSWELFEQLDFRDLGIDGQENGLQGASCIGISDRFVENNGTLKEFIEKLQKLLSEIND